MLWAVKLADVPSPGASGTGPPFSLTYLQRRIRELPGLAVVRVTGGTANVKVEGRIAEDAPFVSMGIGIGADAAGKRVDVAAVMPEMRATWTLCTGSRIEVWLMG